MLTTEQIRKVAAQSGARDIEKVEIDIILTDLLQLFHEKGITEHVAFKGGTMLRKMIFGPRGRYSTDLDFTLRSEFTDEQVMQMVLDALGESYHGISFKIDGKDWDFTDNSFFANPACSHAGNEKGIKIKIQVSLREKPILPVRTLPQLKQGYFDQLPFKPADIPCLAHEEVLSEKIRAASQRSKIRDLHDLSQAVNMKFDRDLTRSLAVIKLWESDKDNLDYDKFAKQVEGGKDYDLNDLRNLLRKDEQPDLKAMIKRVTDNYRWLGPMTDLEKRIAQDSKRTRKDDAAALKADAVKRAG
ncbi:putative nucleotidyltransferase component of viral defense system [Bradyrhizobium algeriense]|uniref:Nucleotidyltransferase component of viral defense system n=1 Tax=Bradyrhizobium algeriense TaxID=634784 RepID=A0ABU8BPX4_9BRAD